jgi:hypothetical protein
MTTTNDHLASTAGTDDQRVQTRLGVGAMLVPLFFAVAFAACIIGSYHRPHPNDIRVAVVGPAAQPAPLRAQLQKAAGTAFEISQAPTVAEAAHAVRQRDLNAAFVPTGDPRRPATVIVASANGRIVATAAESLARAVTAAQGAQLVVREVRPLPPGDEIGLGVFMCEGRAAGIAPEQDSYGSFATFRDPDGNAWLLQEVTVRLPGRVNAAETRFTSTADLAAAMRRASVAHGEHEAREGGEYDLNWPDWYAAYMVAEQAGTELPT